MTMPVAAAERENSFPVCCHPFRDGHGDVDLYRYEAGASFTHCATCSTGTPLEAAVICLPALLVSIFSNFITTNPGYAYAVNI